MISDAARDFLAANAPIAHARAMRDAGQVFDPALWQQMIALGCLLAGPTGDALLPGLLTLGLALLWLSALLTVITGYDYLRDGLRHVQS